VPEGKQKRAAHPQLEKVIMTGTLQHLDPAILLVGLGVAPARM